MEKGVGSPEPYHDYQLTIAQNHALVENAWPKKCKNGGNLPMAIVYKDAKNRRIRAVTPAEPGGYSMRNVCKMFPIICDALDIDPQFEFEQDLLSDNYFAKSQFLVDSVEVTIGKQMGNSREEAKRRCQLAILHRLLEQDIISECALEMHEYKEEQAKKELEKKSKFPTQLVAIPLPQSSFLRLSASDASLLFDSLVPPPVDFDHHEVLRTQFVDLISKSTSPFHTGICVAKASLQRLYVNTATNDPRYKALIEIRESDMDYYSITLSQSVRRDLEAYHYGPQEKTSLQI